MSSKSIPVEHGGITWKVIPGSRREQVLRRMIEQDRRLNHQVPPADHRTLRQKIEGHLVVIFIAGIMGFAAGLFVRVIQMVLP